MNTERNPGVDQPRPFSRYVKGVETSLSRWARGQGSGSAAWFRASRSLARWALISVPIGIVAGFGAVAFFSLWLLVTELLLGGVVGITYPLEGLPNGGFVQWASSSPRILLLIPVMVLAGLAVGVIAQRFAPEVAGHGTDSAIHAFHHSGGKIRARVPLLKILTSALSLGSGGAGGREGPVAQVGSGFGSVWADALHLSPQERRIALATGLGAGVGAIFKAPLGGALYATEIFYMGDFEPEVFVPGVMASVTSYAIYGLFFGFGTLFTAPVGLSWNVEQLPFYALLGFLCAGVGIAFIQLFRGSQTWFTARKWPLQYTVALGAFLSSISVIIVYYLVPVDNHFVSLSSVNVGYGFVQSVMVEQTGLESLGLVAVVVLVLAVVVRMITTSMTVASGGSAGLFGTSVVIGAFLGSSVGLLFHSFLPQAVPLADIAAFAIVGMMAFFGGISKAPLAVLVMVVEMAGSYSLLLPAMLAIFIAYAMTGNFHIYNEQFQSRVNSPAHREEFREFLLREIPVTSLELEPHTVLPPSTSVAEALLVVAETGQTVIPVVDEGQFVGLVSFRALSTVPESDRGKMPIMDVASPSVAVVTSEASAEDALRAMRTAGTSIAAIVSANPPVTFMGLVTRGGILHLLPRTPETE